MFSLLKNIIAGFICLLLFLPAVDGHARITGSFEWDFGHFEAEESGTEVAVADHFAQRYSLLYQMEGLIMEGRGGDYDLALGGEWTNLDSDITINSVDNDVEIETSKVFYRGELLFAPGGIPFRLHAYSRDMHAARFEEDNRLFTGGNFDSLILTPNVRNILDPQVLEDVDDGTAVETGLSLILGIRNGSYLGRYRDILSNFPKLFVDYREFYVKDLKSLSPEHYKDRELAYVSLNKKHNWIHYRFFDHQDEINPADNASRRMILIGNVDQLLNREWVNLTNWIQVSTDGRYVTDVNPDNILGSENLYQLNLFSKTRRSNWNSSMFSSFHRWEKIDELERTAFVPIFVNGDIDRDRSWRFKFIGDAEKTVRPFSLVGQTSINNGVYALTRFDLNKTQTYKVSPQLEVEIRNASDIGRGEGSAVSLGVDIATNKDRVVGYALHSNVDFTYFEGEPTALSSNETDYWEVAGAIEFAKDMNVRTRAGVVFEFVYGSGTFDADITEHIARKANMDLIPASSDVEVVDSTQRYDLSLFWENLSQNRVKNRIETELSFLEIDQLDNDRFTILHRLEYHSRASRFDMVNEAVVGDNLKSSNGGSAMLDRAISSSYFDGWNFASTSKYRYAPNKYWLADFILDLNYANSDQPNDGGYTLGLSQNYEYRIFTKTGRLRKVASFEEVLDFEMFDLKDGTEARFVMFALIGNYYPTSWFHLGARVRTQRDLENSSDETGFGLYADLNFSKFDLGVEYEIGMRTDDTIGTVMDRDEQRWQVSIKKTF